MKTIQVFEPALCCNTGVCGPNPAQELVTFTADLGYLQGQGVDIRRHNLANDPLAFAQAEPVRAFLETAGSDGLPLTLADGAVVLTGRYPTRTELARFAGLDAGEPAATSGCCGGSDCGCGEPTATPASTACCDGPDCEDGKPTDAPASSACCGGSPEPAAASGCGCGSDSGCC